MQRNKKINEKVFFVVHAWMVTQLNLRTVERDVYAIIYGYSQDEDSDFHGSLEYLSQLTGYSRNSICTALKSLVEKDLIIKTESTNNNIKSCRYKAKSVQAVCTGNDDSVQDTCIEKAKSVQAVCTNNKNIDNIDNNTNNINIISRKPTKRNKNLYEKCIDYINEYTNNSKLYNVLSTYVKFRLEIKDKPLYANQFKGMLNKLNTLADNSDDMIKIVQQSLDNAWLSFYPLKSYNRNKTNDVRVNIEQLGTTNIPRMSDEEKEELQRRADNGELETF